MFPRRGNDEAMMRFRQIEVFHAIYTAGSISGAARMLRVSQPSVSKVLHHMQKQLGLELFRLHRGRLVATEEAHALFKEADEVFIRLNSLHKAIGNIRSNGDCHVRLAVLPSLGLEAAPVAIARFRQAYPDASFDVQTLHHDDLHKALYERRADIAIAYDPPSHPQLIQRNVATASLVLMSRTDQLQDMETVGIDYLDGKDLVGLTIGGPVGNLFSRYLRNAEVQVREVVSNQTFYVAAELVRQGVGMAVLDEFTARAWSDPATRFVPLAPSIKFWVQCVHLAERPPSLAAEQFLEVFTQVVHEILARPARYAGVHEKVPV